MESYREDYVEEAPFLSEIVVLYSYTLTSLAFIHFITQLYSKVTLLIPSHKSFISYTYNFLYYLS
jgi:hypothetical protein